MKTTTYRGLFVVLLSLLLVGCLTQKPKWMATFLSDPDQFNHTFTNENDTILYARRSEDNLLIEHFDYSGANIHSSSLPILIDESKGFFALPNGSFFASGDTTASIVFVDTTAETYWQGIETPFLQDGEVFNIAGIYNHQNNLALYGSVQFEGADIKGLVVVINAVGDTIASFSSDGIVRFSSIVTEAGGNISIQTSDNDVITLTDEFSEIGRFSLPSGKSLIALSIDHPVLLVASGSDIQRVDANGGIQWTYDNPDIPSVKGQSTDNDGNIVLWGDKSNFNLFNMKTDLATYDKIAVNGTRQWLFQSDDKMNSIKYANIDHRVNGETTISYQGWKGELAGLLIGGTTATPVRVTRSIEHDTISALGKRVTHRVEPARTEVYAQCGLLCIEITTETEGHCESIDVAYLGKNIAAISKVCGAEEDNTITLSYF